jgi:hypothetical protein
MAAKKMDMERLGQLIVDGFDEMRTEIISEVNRKIDSKIDEFRAENNQRLADIETAQANHSMQLRSVTQGLIEVIEKLDPLIRAFDRDAVVLQDHGKRIVRLEKLAQRS